MSEEKRLNDEALEKVTGGTIDISGLSEEQRAFIGANCIGCRFEGPGTCPYGGNNKEVAIPKAMSEGGTKCVKWQLPDV